MYDLFQTYGYLSIPVDVIALAVLAGGWGAHPVRRLTSLAAGSLPPWDLAPVDLRVRSAGRRRWRAILFGLLVTTVLGLLGGTAALGPNLAAVAVALAVGELLDVRRAHRSGVTRTGEPAAVAARRPALVAAAGAVALAAAGAAHLGRLATTGHRLGADGGLVVDGVCHVAYRPAALAPWVINLVALAGIGVLMAGSAVAVARRPAWPDVPATVDDALRQSSVWTLLGVFATTAWFTAGVLLVALAVERGPCGATGVYSSAAAVCGYVAWAIAVVCAVRLVLRPLRRPAAAGTPEQLLHV